MNWEELLAACPTGLPSVQWTKMEYKGRNIEAQFKRGVVTTIKDGKGYKGVGVQFKGVNYETWFYAEVGNDGRKRYMKDLKLLANE